MKRLTAAQRLASHKRRNAKAQAWIIELRPIMEAKGWKLSASGDWVPR